MANERSAREALGDGVGDVVDGRNLHEANGLAREAPAYHGLSGSHPSGGFLEALASRAVNDCLGIGKEKGGGSGGHTDIEVRLERAQSEDVLVGECAHAKLGSTGAVVTRDRCRHLPGQGPSAVAE